MSQFGQAYKRVLPTNHQEALFAAAEILYDAMIDDLREIDSGVWTIDAEQTQCVTNSLIAGSLPPRYQLRYTAKFMKRFHLCMLTVVWKLGQPKPMKLSCVAEELAAHLVIEQAGAWLELMGKDADFSAFEDMLYEDLDFELLYENRYDGVENSALADEMGLANLAFADWFARFGPSESTTYLEPHPLCFEDADEESGEGSSTNGDL